MWIIIRRRRRRRRRIVIIIRRRIYFIYRALFKILKDTLQKLLKA